MAKMGRPSSYTEEIAAEILERLAEGEPLSTICEDENLPHRVTVFRWMEQRDDFRNKYTRARELCGHASAERAIREGLLATTEDAQAQRLKFDALRWYASKLAPRTYGDRVTQEHTGTVALQHDTIDRPPVETREQWIARRQHELDTARLALGPAAGSAD